MQPAREFAQGKPNKPKQNRLDFLGFIRLNRDFSTGYGDSCAQSKVGAAEHIPPSSLSVNHTSHKDRHKIIASGALPAQAVRPCGMLSRQNNVLLYSVSVGGKLLSELHYVIQPALMQQNCHLK
jgi:hypothetical protein